MRSVTGDGQDERLGMRRERTPVLEHQRDRGGQQGGLIDG